MTSCIFKDSNSSHRPPAGLPPSVCGTSRLARRLRHGIYTVGAMYQVAFPYLGCKLQMHHHSKLFFDT